MHLDGWIENRNGVSSLRSVYVIVYAYVSQGQNSSLKTSGVNRACLTKCTQRVTHSDQKSPRTDYLFSRPFVLFFVARGEFYATQSGRSKKH